MTLMSPSRSSSDFTSAFHVACTTAAQRTIRKTPIDIVISGHPVEVVWTRKLSLSEFLDTACKGQIRTYATAGVKDGFRRVSLIPVRAGEGRLTERIAAIRSWRRELVFMPHCGQPQCSTDENGRLSHQTLFPLGRGLISA
jgi:hypothetical protein